MRFGIDKIKQEKHLWFAWRPVRVAGGWVWLEDVWRTGTLHAYSNRTTYWTWEYRL